MTIRVQNVRIRVNAALAGSRSATVIIARPSAAPIHAVKIMIAPRMIHTAVNTSGMIGTECMMTMDHAANSEPYRMAGTQMRSFTSRFFTSDAVAAVRVRSPNSQALHANRLLG